MNLMRDPDALIAAWLDENALPLPTETRRAIAVDVRTTPQRQRPIWPLRRYPFMITPLRIAAVAALGLGIALTAYLTLGPALQSNVGAPAPTTSPAASAESSPLPDVSTWTGYTSTDDGYTLSHPADWQPFPRDGEVWFSGGPPEQWQSGFAVHRYDAGGLDQAAWLEANCGVRNGAFGDAADAIALVPCEPIGSWVSTEVAGTEALTHYDGMCCYDTVVFAGENVYVISATGGFSADRPLTDAFLSTLRFDGSSG